MASGLRLLSNLLYPPGSQCLCCGELRLSTRGDCLCPGCRAGLLKSAVGLRTEGLWLYGIYAPFHYEAEARQLIKRLKYGGIKAAAQPLGLAMAERMSAEGSFDALVPIPLHKSRLRQRGFNQAEALAVEMAAQCGAPLLHALLRSRKTRQQARLDREKRHSNMENAFTCTADVAGKRLLLIDDVCTTGATAESCAHALRLKGAGEVCLCVAALAELHGWRRAE